MLDTMEHTIPMGHWTAGVVGEERSHTLQEDSSRVSAAKGHRQTGGIAGGEGSYSMAEKSIPMKEILAA